MIKDKEGKIMKVQECIDFISEWYLSDTIELIDLVLDDDNIDPEYSAITALNRLWVYLQYKKHTEKDYDYGEVSSFLIKSGYLMDDIDTLKEKVQEERKVNLSEILDKQFLS